MRKAVKVRNALQHSQKNSGVATPHTEVCKQASPLSVKAELM